MAVNIMQLGQYAQQGYADGRKNRLASLLGQAYTAPQDQRQGLLGQAAQIDPVAAGQYGQQLQGQDDQGMERVAKAAMFLARAPEHARPKLYAQMLPSLRQAPALAGVLPDAYDAQVDGVVQQFGQIYGGGQAPSAVGYGSSFVNDQGEQVAIMEDGSTKILGKVQPKAEPTLTPYQQAQLGIQRDRLELSRQNAGGGGITPYQQARLELDKKRLELAEQKGAAGNGGSPLPVGALKMLLADEEALATTETLDSTLGKYEKQLQAGELELGPVENMLSGGRNYLGQSSQNSRNFGSFSADLEKMRNESLRLNSGVQTDGDAQRAWAELVANINDGPFVLQRLQEIRALNKRAAQLRQRKIEMVKQNYRSGQAPETRGPADLSDDELLRELGL